MSALDNLQQRLAEALAVDLKAQDITQSALAAHFGKTQQAVGLWILRGRIPARHHERLIEILGERSAFARTVSGFAPVGTPLALPNSALGRAAVEVLSEAIVAGRFSDTELLELMLRAKGGSATHVAIGQETAPGMIAPCPERAI